MTSANLTMRSLATGVTAVLLLTPACSSSKRVVYAPPRHSFFAEQAADAAANCPKNVRKPVVYYDSELSDWYCIDLAQVAGHFDPEELGYVTRCPGGRV